MQQQLAAVSARHYVHRLDLGADPFLEGFRSDYFYDGGGRRQVLEQVLHYSRYSDQLVLLVGSTGSGTSTILDQLLNQLEPLMDFCTVDAESNNSPEYLLATLCEQLQLNDIHSATEFIAELRHNAEVTGVEEPLLIAVDQGHFLGMESLDLLRQLQELSNGLLHILLAGEYQIESLLKLCGFNSDRIKLLELEPLTEAESGEYLLGLLHAVGYAGEQPLSGDQLAVLHEQSGGNVAEINLLAPKLLDVKQAAAKSGFTTSIPWFHVAAILILVLAVGLSYWYQSDSSEGYESLGGITGEMGKAQQADDDQQVLRIEKAPLEVQRETDPVPGEVIALDDDVASEPEPAPVGDRSHEAAVVHNAVDVDDEMKTDAAVAQSAPLSGVSPAPELNRDDRGDPANAPLAAKPKSQLTDNGAEKSLPLSRESQEGLSEVSDREVVAPPLPVGVQRLLQMENTAYVLQLMGAVEEVRARQLVAEYEKSLPIFYVESRRQGKPWYVVVMGPYASKEAARNGVDKLPVKLQRQQPWPRSVAGLKGEVRQR